MNLTKLIDIALSYVGISGNCPAFHQLLGQIEDGHLFPLDKPFGKGGISSCAVVARGFLRILGFPLGEYKIQSGLNDAIEYAKEYHAYFNAKDKLELFPGCVVMIQGKTSIHVLTVIEVNGDKPISVDGGMVDEKTGLQAIKRCERIYNHNQYSIDGKSIIGVIDASMI